MSAITFGSVCSGIEAASVAWAPLGWRAAWLAEIEPFPCALLAHHYPEVPNLGDMTKIGAMIRDGFASAPDVLCGGTPCQAFSVAGLRQSLDDGRGNLSLTFCEIADEIDARRQAAGLLPAVIFWENVPGVLNTKDNAFGCFLAGLAGEDDPLIPSGGKWTNAGCVFGPERTVAWRVLDAQYFGVAQRRRRVFVVASARDGFDPTAVLFEQGGVRRDTAPSRATREEFAHDLAPCLTSSGRGVERTGDTRGQDPVVAVANVCQTLRAGGNSTGGDRPPGTDVDTADSLVVHALPLAFDCKASGMSGFGVGKIASTMRAMGHANSHQNGGGHLAVCTVAIGCDGTVDGPVPPLMARSSRGGAQTLSPGHQTDGHMISVCVTGDITHTLKAEGFDASEDGTGRGQPIVTVGADCYNGSITGEVAATMGARGSSETASGPVLLTGMAVRRLTPRECERLQGFPDDYTLVPHRNKAAADGPRYKALGNSWAVPNVAWIGRRIDAQLRGVA